jgi:anthranilate synthase component 1
MKLKRGLPSRFAGGFVGYLSYDFIRYLVDVGSHAEDSLREPDAEFTLTRNNIVFDHVARKIFLTSNIFSDEDEDDARESLNTLVDDFLDLPLNMPGAGADARPMRDVAFTSNMTQHEYEEAVRAGKKYIRAGDIFQVVLSQKLSADYSKDTISVYEALKNINPSPYMYYLDFGGRKIVGASPEMLARVEGKTVLTYPIAGTRSRGKTVREDRRLAEEMLKSEKERAEHVMLVDLGRNDLGRVSEFGSVRVNKFMAVEKYSHVQHLVSEVEGKLRNGCDAFDALASVFPAGTVSGAPKVRAMEIIDELEPDRRGVYAGCVGYTSFNGNMDTAITIRTIVFEKGKAHAQAGAGIVADSVPEHEYKETLKKANALIKSLGYE